MEQQKQQPPNNGGNQQNQQVATFQQQKQHVSGLLERYKSQIARALPANLDADRMIQIALNGMSKQPDIFNCSPVSIISVVLTVTQLGLMPDNVLGESYMIPFNNKKKGTKELTLIIGYKGLIKLAMRSPKVSKIIARAVYEGDEFDWELGTDEYIKHKRQGQTAKEKITHFYAIITLQDGSKVFDVMFRKEVEDVRDESKNYKYALDKESTIWAKNFDEMGKKTVLRRLMKFVPLSEEISKAISIDESLEYGKQNVAIAQFDDLQGDEIVDGIAEVLNQDEEQAEDNKQSLQDKAKAAEQGTLNMVNEKNKAQS